eukprot:UC4_evm1s697
MIKLQETPEKIPDGQTPQTVLLFCFDDLVDKVQAGDRIEVTGVYRATPLRLNPRQRSVKAVYKTHLDVIHFNTENSGRAKHDSAPTLHLSDKRKEELRNLASQTDIYDRLARSFAPNVFGYEDTKKGMLAQLFGGTNKTNMSES